MLIWKLPLEITNTWLWTFEVLKIKTLIEKEHTAPIYVLDIMTMLSVGVSITWVSDGC